MGSVGPQRSFPSNLPRFTVGRDHHGWWVVHDRQERVGGLFRSCEAALHFAAGECDATAEICLAQSDCVVELGGFTADPPSAAAVARQPSSATVTRLAG